MSTQTTKAAPGLDSDRAAELSAQGLYLTPPGAGDATAGTTRDCSPCLTQTGFNSRLEGPDDCPECGRQMAHVVEDGTVSLQCQDDGCVSIAWLGSEPDCSMVGQVIVRDCPECGAETKGTLYAWCDCGWCDLAALEASEQDEHDRTKGAL